MKLQRRQLPVAIVAGVVALILGFKLLSIVLSERTGTVDPYVTLKETSSDHLKAKQLRQKYQAYVGVADGEVARTEQRLREGLALATASSIFSAYKSSINEKPPTVNELLRGVQFSGLLPPGMQLGIGDGAVGSEHGPFFVRYRPEPLGVEVVSVGKERLDGPTLIVRVPDDRSETGARIYQATRLDDIIVPPPFAHETQVIALGYSLQPSRVIFGTSLP